MYTHTRTHTQLLVSSVEVSPSVLICLILLGFLLKDQQDVDTPQVKRNSPGRREYLMVLQVPLCIGPHVPYFLSCVFQLLLYEFKLLIYREA